ncbi:RNA-guided endonuclease InsQ/TnpB family protein [Gloeobacter morelensis]|uniref:RNA-guided endonuclease InsQ/TnpB family protein n=1 Tax=Gloeobacter morelensis TaxID=2907343 RepID=UPI001E64F680|nr:transposase [Gloeobacter morelensis]
MYQAFKYRLEPNKSQERELEIVLETHRRLYNDCLEQRKTAYESEKRTLKYTEQSAWFKSQRTDNPWFAALNFSSAQATMRRLDKAFAAFFQRIKAGQTPGYPRFRSRSRFDSFTYPSLGDGVRVMGRKLRLQRIGLVRINLHRPTEGEAKTVTVLTKGGKWYVVITCEVEGWNAPDSPLPATGIDVGIESFLTTADGFSVPTVRPLKHQLKRLRREQRSLSRKKRGSKSRLKQRRKVARVHARVANTRRDVHHKVSRELTRRYGAIAVENLNIAGMLRNHCLARAIADAGWYQFRLILTHKAEKAGVQVVGVNARGTSQECSACGLEVKKMLSVRWHECSCGCSLHRDQNAARNILNRGLLAGMRPGNVKAGDTRLCSRSRLL